MIEAGALRNQCGHETWRDSRRVSERRSGIQTTEAELTRFGNHLDSNAGIQVYAPAKPDLFKVTDEPLAAQKDVAVLTKSPLWVVSIVGSFAWDPKRLPAVRLRRLACTDVAPGVRIVAEVVGVYRGGPREHRWYWGLVGAGGLETRGRQV